MAKQLLGKEVTAALNERIKGNVAALQEKGVNPTLCIIRVGENPSDISYEKGATKRCETLGVACELFQETSFLQSLIKQRRSYPHV